MGRKRTKAPKPNSDDYGSLYRAQHMDGLEKEVRDRSGTGQPTSFGMRAKAECKLDAYWNRMLVTWKQYQAGMVVRRLFIAAHMQPNVTSSYGERIVGDIQTGLMACNTAKARLRKAMQSIGGSLQPVAYQVCCDDDWANVGRNQRKGGIQLLRQALSALADHFQISDVEAVS